MARARTEPISKRMKSNDARELPITNACADTARAYDAYVDEFISYGARLRDLFEAADAAPDCALVNAHAAALHLAFEGAEGWTHAAPYLARMKAAAHGLSERERLFCAAVSCWSEKEFHGALAALDDLTVRWPADLCALKWGQYHAFNLGDQNGLLRFGERARVVHENTPYAHGMIAFALEQNHRLEEAEEEGYRAAEIAIDDAWAHHAVAHVMETQGRAEDGVRWLDHCAHTWERKGVFIRDHNWWHAALFRMSLERYDDALAVYDERLWGAWPEFPQEQIGAVSALWRLEMRGVDVGDRWAPVLEQARARVGEHILPFHDVHYLYALARAGAPGEAEAFLQSMTTCAEQKDHRARAVWRSVASPCGEAMIAFAQGDFAVAAEGFTTVEPALHQIGGSHAQRHLFVEARRAAEAAAGGAATTAPSRIGVSDA